MKKTSLKNLIYDEPKNIKFLVQNLWKSKDTIGIAKFLAPDVRYLAIGPNFQNNNINIAKKTMNIIGYAMKKKKIDK